MNEPLNPEVAILNAALELGVAQRAAYLDEACAGNPALPRGPYGRTVLLVVTNEALAGGAPRIRDGCARDEFPISTGRRNAFVLHLCLS